jgi:hypothetical protein
LAGTNASSRPFQSAGGRNLRRNRRRGLTGLEDIGDDLPNRYLIAGTRADMSQRTSSWSLKLDGDFIRLDLSDWLTLPYLVTLGLEPLDNGTGVLGHT